MNYLHRHTHPRLPGGLRIGERLLVLIDTPDQGSSPYPSRLQDLSPEGYLCIDAPIPLSPPPGTHLTITSRLQEWGSFSFSSQVLDHQVLGDRLPVLLVKPPESIQRRQRRSAYRIPVSLPALVEWGEEDHYQEEHGIISNLSGGGAQIMLRQVPDPDPLWISITVPDRFVQEWARRQVAKTDTPLQQHPFFFHDPLAQKSEKIRAGFRHIQARTVHQNLRTTDHKGPLFALSVAFTRPEEGCHRLVRFLERQSLQKGIHDRVLSRAS